jgi:predicted O-methyltransferase YrrM
MSAADPTPAAPPPQHRSPARRVARQSVARLARKMGLSTRAEVRHQINDTFEQVTALLELQALLGQTGPWRPFRGWAISPDAARWLSALVVHHRPALIVECGAGTSSLVLAATLSAYDIEARLVTLEHDGPWADHIRSRLVGYDVAAEVRHAPLRLTPEAPGGWYDPAGWEDLGGIDLLVVDGPPQVRGVESRRPVIDRLGPRLAESGVVALDDADRPAEAALVAAWLAADPRMVRRDLAAEKGLCLLSRSAQALAVELPDPALGVGRISGC